MNYAIFDLAILRARLLGWAKPGTNSEQGHDDGDEDKPLSPAMTPYTKNVLRGELCAYMYGYEMFLPETVVSVQSMARFMPGMRVAIATTPNMFSVYNR